MTPARRRFGHPAGIAALVVAAALAGCAPGPPAAPPAPAPATTSPVPTTNPSTRPPTTKSPSSSSSSPSSPSSPSPSSEPTSAAASTTAVTVRINGGKATGRVQTVRVPAGQVVELTGESDVADSLHVHGYDKTLQLSPGKAASLRFVADVKGVYEVEAHETGTLVAKLTVS